MELWEIVSWIFVIVLMSVGLELDLLGKVNDQGERLKSAFVDAPHAVVDEV